MKTTGRKFKCIGNKEVRLVFWSQFFTVGSVYNEIESELDILLLMGDSGETWYVDASQFELVESC